MNSHAFTFYKYSHHLISYFRIMRSLIQSEPALNVAFCPVLCPPIQNTTFTKASGGPPVRAVYLASQKSQLDYSPWGLGVHTPLLSCKQAVWICVWRGNPLPSIAAIRQWQMITIRKRTKNTFMIFRNDKWFQLSHRTDSPDKTLLRDHSCH